MSARRVYWGHVQPYWRVEVYRWDTAIGQCFVAVLRERSGGRRSVKVAAWAQSCECGVEAVVRCGWCFR